MQKQIINEFFRDIREFKKRVLAKTNNTFKISFIKYIKNEDGKNIDTKRFTLQKSFYAKNIDKVIFNNKIYFKNREKYENIYISIDDTNNKTNLLWLDDIKLENFTKEQLKYITLIETSPNNFQGYIILDKELNKNELKQVKKYFCKNYNTDTASVDFTHLMRLPYFYSYKHNEPFYVIVKQWQNKILNIQPILNKLQTENRIQQQNIKINKINNINMNTLQQLYNKYLKIKEKELKNKIDYNVIDYRFIHYLHYFTNINIHNIRWENILHNLKERKAGHISDYINRTINKIVGNNNYKNNDIHILQQLLNV